MKTKSMIAIALASVMSFAGVSAAQAVEPSPAIATITGTPKLGSSLTVTFDPTYTIVGDFFDIWMCPNKNVLPIDEIDEGDCIAVTFWNRAMVTGYDQQTTARTMKWEISDSSVNGLNPSNNQPYLQTNGDPITVEPPTDENGEPISWCTYEGWYMIINDYDGGGHSNWTPAMSADGCDSGSDAEALAPTGGSQTAGVVALVLGIMATIAAVAMRPRRRVQQ
jgi:hypothetical protein